MQIPVLLSLRRDTWNWFLKSRCHHNFQYVQQPYSLPVMMVILKGFVDRLNNETYLLYETKSRFLCCLLCQLYRALRETYISVLKLLGLNFHRFISKNITKLSYNNRPDRLPQMCYFAMLEFKKIKSIRKTTKFCVSEKTVPPFGDQVLFMQLLCFSFILTPSSQCCNSNSCAWVITSVLHFLNFALIIVLIRSLYGHNASYLIFLEIQEMHIKPVYKILVH